MHDILETKHKKAHETDITRGLRITIIYEVKQLRKNK